MDIWGTAITWSCRNGGLIELSILSEISQYLLSGNPVGSNNQTECAIVYDCCYNQYEQGGQHNAVNILWSAWNEHELEIAL